MGALLLLLVGPIWIVGGGLGMLHLAAGGIGELFGRGTRRRGLLKLGLVALAVGAPILAIRWAEASNGWADRDRDGMLDGMANGSYDWLDINLGDFLRIWFLLCVPLAVAGYLVSRWPSRSRPPRSRVPERAVSRS